MTLLTHTFLRTLILTSGQSCLATKQKTSLDCEHDFHATNNRVGLH